MKMKRPSMKTVFWPILSLKRPAGMSSAPKIRAYAFSTQATSEREWCRCDSMVCNATVTMNRFTTLITLARASVARTMFVCPCSCSAVADVVVAIAQPYGARTARPRSWPASGPSWIAAVSVRSPRSRCPSAVRRRQLGLRSPLPARNPEALSGVAGEQDCERPAVRLRVRTPGVVTSLISSPLRSRGGRRRRG